LPEAARPARWWSVLVRSTVTVAAVLADVAVIVTVSVLVGLGYHLAMYGTLGPVPGFVALGTSAASIFVLPGLFRGEYEFTHYLSFRQHVGRAFAYWNITFVALLVLAFMTRSLEDYSRASMVLFYLAGLPTLIVTRYAVVSTVLLGSRAGIVTTKRVFLIGTAEDITDFLRRYQPWNLGLHIVGAASLSRFDPQASHEGHLGALVGDLRGALDSARRLHPEAVYIVGPWSETGTIEACVDEFLKMPVEIHLGPERVLDRFDSVRIAKHGSMASLQLTRAPLTWSERMLKRAFDVTVAAGILIVLAPLLALTALLIY